MNENYSCLKAVLDAAFEQASAGKGAERHGQGGDLDFMEQPMMSISALLNSDGGLAYQAIKKIVEARGMKEFARQERELLGAINYIAGMIMHLRRIDQQQRGDADFDNAAQQFESLTGCCSHGEAVNQERRHKISIVIPKEMLSPEFMQEFRENAERYFKANQNPLNLAPQQAGITANTIMMVEKLKEKMVSPPDPDHFAGHEDVACVVNAGGYWATANNYPDLYARRFVDVVKSQAMLNPGKTIMANMIGYHDGYNLDLTSQRDYILELLDRGGMFTVTTYPQKSLIHSLRVVYNHK